MCLLLFLYLSLYQYSYYYHIILAYPESIISYPNLLLQSSSHLPLFNVFVVCSDFGCLELACTSFSAFGDHCCRRRRLRGTLWRRFRIGTLVE
jgi:hypothetical protein